MKQQLKFLVTLLILALTAGRQGCAEIELCPQELTLHECLQMARQSNRSLEIACLSTEKAVETKNEVRSILLPSLSVDGVWDNRNDALDKGLTQFQNFKSNKALGIKANWNIFDFGASWMRLKAANQRIQAAQLTQEGTVLSVEEQVKTTYYQILAQKGGIAVVEASLRTLERQLKQSKNLFEEGMAKHSDVLAVEVKLSDKQQRLMQEKNRLAILRMNLNRLIGLPLFETPTLKDVCRSLPSSPSFEAAYQFALENRRDYLALCKQIEALGSDYKAGRLSHLPQFYAFGNGNIASKTKTASVGIGMNIPLFEGGRKRAQNNRLRVELCSLRTSLVELENGMAIEIQNAQLELEEISKSLILNREAIDLAEATLRNYNDLYREGEVSISEILLAEESLTQVKMGYTANLYRYWITLARLNTITGGMYEV